MDNKIIPVAIFSTLAILLTMAVLVPICAEVTDQSVARYNNSEGLFAMATPDEIVTLDYAFVDGAQSWAVNGQAITGLTYDMLLITDVNALLGSSTTPRFIGQDFGRQDNVRSMHAVISDNTITGTLTTANNTFNLNLNFEWAYYVSPTGDYRSMSANTETKTVYVHDINDIHYANWNFTLSTWFSGNGGNVTLGSGDVAEVHAELIPVAGVNGIYSVTVGPGDNDFNFVSDNGGQDYATHPLYYIVPASVSGEKITNGFAVNSLISMVPVLVIAGLVLMLGVGVVRSKLA